MKELPAERERLDVSRKRHFERIMFQKHCKIVIAAHSLANKFQPLDISVNKAAKAFIQNQYNDWFSYKISVQLTQLTSKLQNYQTWKLYMHPRSYEHLSDNQGIIVNGFNSAGILEVVTKACTILDKVESPFREVKKLL